MSASFVRAHLKIHASEIYLKSGLTLEQKMADLEKKMDDIAVDTQQQMDSIESMLATLLQQTAKVLKS